jgi:hypothetical protein
MPTIEVRTKVTGANAPLEPVFLELVSERITLRELIRRTVAQQIQELTITQRLDVATTQVALARQYLSEDEVAVQAEAGRVKMPSTEESQGPRVNVEAEIKKALRAFTAQRFFVFAGGRQVENLDEELDFAQQTQVTFLRLTPLRGG